MSTSPSDDKKSGAASKSRRESGEALHAYSDAEWDRSDEPYSAELLNLKKKPNRVNVFTASNKIDESLTIVENTAKIEKKIKPEFHNLARLIHNTCEAFLTNSDSANSQLHIKLDFTDIRNE